MLLRLVTGAALLLTMAGSAFGWSCDSPLEGETVHEMYINGTKAGKIEKEADGWSAYCLKAGDYVREDGRKFYGEDYSAAARTFCDRCEEP